MWGRSHVTKSRVAQKGVCTRGAEQELRQMKVAARWALEGGAHGPGTLPTHPHPTLDTHGRMTEPQGVGRVC